MIRRLSRVAPFVFVLLAVLGALYAVSRHGDELRSVLGRMGAVPVLEAIAFGAAGVFMTFLMWRELLRGLGASVKSLDASRVFFVSQLGKYLPGSVWPVVAQMEYGRRNRTGRGTMLAANALTVAFSLAAGLLLAAVSLPFASTSGLRQYWWTFACLPFLLALLHPRVITGMLDWLFRRLGRAELNQRPSWLSVLRAVGWAFASWILLGLHLWFLLRGVGAEGWRLLPAAVGGFALAVSAGVLFIPAPAGAGVRDAVLIATLNATVDGATALAVGLASRVLLIVVDLLAAAVFGWGGRFAERGEATDVDERDSIPPLR